MYLCIGFIFSMFQIGLFIEFYQFYKFARAINLPIYIIVDRLNTIASG
jgi:hypothetical protein